MDERKTVSVLKAETLTWVFSSSSPFWKRVSKPFEYSMRSLSSKEYSHMISIKYMRESLMLRASTEERVVMMWMSYLSCFWVKKNVYDVGEKLDEDFAASFQESQWLFGQNHVLDTSDDKFEFWGGNLLEVVCVVQVFLLEQEGSHGWDLGYKLVTWGFWWAIETTKASIPWSKLVTGIC